jgi:hypothetical protein
MPSGDSSTARCCSASAVAALNSPKTEPRRPARTAASIVSELPVRTCWSCPSLSASVILASSAEIRRSVRSSLPAAGATATATGAGAAGPAGTGAVAAAVAGAAVGSTGPATSAPAAAPPMPRSAARRERFPGIPRPPLDPYRPCDVIELARLSC